MSLNEFCKIMHIGLFTCRNTDTQTLLMSKHADLLVHQINSIFISNTLCMLKQVQKNAVVLKLS